MKNSIEKRGEKPLATLELFQFRQLLNESDAHTFDMSKINIYYFE